MDGYQPYNYMDKHCPWTVLLSPKIVGLGHVRTSSPTVRASIIESKKIDTALIPGGCTKYIQAPDVCWNKPFKTNCLEYYDEWLETEGIQNETASGNLRPPSCKVIVQWILDAWQKLPFELIRNSCTSCGLTTALDGSEDDRIHCFKEGQPCRSGREMLSEQMKLMHETEEDPCTPPTLRFVQQDLRIYSSMKIARTRKISKCDNDSVFNNF